MPPEQNQDLETRVVALETLLNELQDIVLKLEKDETDEEVPVEGTLEEPKEE